MKFERENSGRYTPMPLGDCRANQRLSSPKHFDPETEQPTTALMTTNTPERNIWKHGSKRGDRLGREQIQHEAAYGLLNQANTLRTQHSSDRPQLLLPFQGYYAHVEKAMRRLSCDKLFGK